MRIGNDLVDLRAAGWRRPRDLRRYSERICTQAELGWLNGNFPHAAGAGGRRRLRAIWSLWAAKEAVYKALDREVNGVFDFVPRQIEILPDSRLHQAKVRMAGAADLAVRLNHAPRWVHALCYPQGENPAPRYWVAPLSLMLCAKHSARRAATDESAAVRSLLRKRLANVIGGSSAPWPIVIRGGRGSGRAPWAELRLSGQREPVRLPISLSHDGDWIAAAAPQIPSNAFE